MVEDWRLTQGETWDIYEKDKGATNVDFPIALAQARELLEWGQTACENKEHAASRFRVEGMPWAVKFDCYLCMEELQQEVME